MSLSISWQQSHRVAQPSTRRNDDLYPRRLPYYSPSPDHLPPLNLRKNLQYGGALRSMYYMLLHATTEEEDCYTDDMAH